MKIDAKIMFSDKIAAELNRSWFRVSVDTDYVEDNEESVREWVGNELSEAFGHSFCREDYEIANMAEILEELKFDEFQRKVKA